jgi:predicted phage terminase large subunit-like protein
MSAVTVIGAGLADNPYLDAEQYKEALNELDPVTREQLLNGKWDIKEAGDMFTRAWFTAVPANDEPLSVRRVRFWDMASTDPTKRKTKSKKDPDWTVGFKLANAQGLYWIEDIIRVQKKPHEVEQIIKDTAELDGYDCAIRMEQEPGSSGDITIDHYARNVLPGYNFAGVRSTGSKVQRAETASAAAQAGRVFILSRCRNMLPFFDELDVFPYGAHDDSVDGFSGAFTYFRNKVLLVGPSSMRKSNGSYWNKLARGGSQNGR